MDKGLSIRLGRASAIQDYDISVALPTRPILSDPKNVTCVTELMKLWVTVGRIQGMIYEVLYSPGAMRKNVSERVASGKQLADETTRWWNDEVAVSTVCKPS